MRPAQKQQKKPRPPVRVRYDPPTLEEAVFAAQGLSEDLAQQIEIAAGLMGVARRRGACARDESRDAAQIRPSGFHRRPRRRRTCGRHRTQDRSPPHGRCAASSSFRALADELGRRRQRRRRSGPVFRRSPARSGRPGNDDPQSKQTHPSQLVNPTSEPGDKDARRLTGLFI